MITRVARKHEDSMREHPTQPISSTSRRPIGGPPLFPLARLRVIITTHPCASLTWLAAFSLLVTGTIIDSAHMSRWALFIVAAAIVLTCRHLAHNVTTSITHVIDLVESDVVIDDDDSPDTATRALVAIDLRQARRLRRRRTLGRITRIRVPIQQQQRLS